MNKDLKKLLLSNNEVPLKRRAAPTDSKVPPSQPSHEYKGIGVSNSAVNLNKEENDG